MRKITDRTRPKEQPRLEAATLLEQAVQEHQQRIDKERVTLAWRTGRQVTADWTDSPMFGSVQGQLFEEG